MTILKWRKFEWTRTYPHTTLPAKVRKEPPVHVVGKSPPVTPGFVTWLDFVYVPADTVGRKE